MIINCIAVDDEPLALNLIKNFISRIPFLKLLETFSDGISVIDYLTTNEVDLIFLDIEMSGLSGTQLLKTLKKKPKVIITTAYRDYAIDAFDLDVTDYLLKPFSFERFLKAVERIRNLIIESQSHTDVIANEKEYIFVKCNGKMVKVNFNDIIYIEALNEYISIKTNSGNIITLQTMKNIEKVLPASKFARIQKSFIVSLSKIDFIEGQFIVAANKKLPIGNKYKKRFFEIISLTGE
jgi:two-component system, LytTR family, response regulator